MSIQALDLLRTIGLLDRNDQVADLSKHSAEGLQSLFDYYAKHRLSQANTEVRTWVPESGDFTSLSSSISSRRTANPFLISALVYSRLIVDDPAVKVSSPPRGDIEGAYDQYLELMPKRGLAGSHARAALQFFEDLAPLIRAGIVVCFPLDILHKPPDSPAFCFSPDWYASEVPPAVHDFVHQNAVVQEMRPGPPGKGLLVLNHAPKKPTRGVAISFRDDKPVTKSSFYLLWEIDHIEKLSESRLRFDQKLPWDKEPDPRHFQAWVYQSVNQAIIARLNAISPEAALAERLGACYLTESGFEARLCGKLGRSSDADAGAVDAVNFLRSNEPLIRVSSARQVLAIRMSCPALFDRFRRTLLAVSSDLHNTRNFQVRAKTLLEKEILPQVQEIEGQARKVVYGTGAAVAQAGATIGLAFLAGQALPLLAVLGCGAVLAAGGALPSVAEYLTSRRSPAFIWRKIMQGQK